MNPLISIIVAAYNVEAYIERCVQSILQSTYTNIELIVVNDGSTDRSASILAAITDERLHVITQNNQGVSAARNAGLRMCQGTFICFVDGDDYIGATMLANMVAAMKDGVDIVETTQYFATDDTCWRKPYQTPVSINGIDLQANKEKCLLITLAPHSRLYRRSLLEGITFPEGKVFEDNYFIAMLLPRLHSFVKLADEKDGYFHYQRMDSTTHTFKENIFDMLAIHEAIYTDFHEQNEEAYYSIIEALAIHGVVYSTLGRKMAFYNGTEEKKRCHYQEIKTFVATYTPTYLKNPNIPMKHKLICFILLCNYQWSKVVWWFVRRR